MAVNQRLAEYKETLDPLVGSATREDMVLRFGMPDKKEQLGKIEVWHYQQSFGTRGGAYVPYGSNYAISRAHEVYDSVTLMFNEEGTLINWRAYVQR